MTVPPRALWFAAIILVAANLRPVISSVPPLVDSLGATFGLSSVAAGALTTLPVVCMGLFAPLAAIAARRFGETAVLAVSVGFIAFGAAVRSVGGVGGLYAGTALAGAGIAVAGTLLPSLVRARVPDRVGPVTGIYTASLIGGALLAAGATEPLRAALGLSAQAVLALWALPALAALALWLPASRRAPTPPRAPAPTAPPAPTTPPAPTVSPTPAVSPTPDRDGRPVGMPWGSPRAWAGTLFMGGQSLLFYSTLAWLAATYTSLGMSAPHAGLLLALFSATQVITALVMPMLAHRFGDVRMWIAISVGLTTVSLALVAAVPMGLVGAAAPWVWASLLGLGMGGNLSLALTVVTQSAPTPRAAAAYTGMAFFVGYLLAAVGPVAAGALRDATGGFTAVFAVLTVLGVGTLVAGIAATRYTTR